MVSADDGFGDCGLIGASIDALEVAAPEAEGGKFKLVPAKRDIQSWKPNKATVSIIEAGMFNAMLMVVSTIFG